MGKIEPGKSYLVTVGNVQFQVTAIRPSAVKGWWHCETEKEGDRIVIPEDSMSQESVNQDRAAG